MGLKDKKEGDQVTLGEREFVIERGNLVEYFPVVYRKEYQPGELEQIVAMKEQEIGEAKKRLKKLKDLMTKTVNIELSLDEEKLLKAVEE